MAIFKYMGCNAAKAFLEEQTIRYCPPNVYNDPFELRTTFVADYEYPVQKKEITYFLHGNSEYLENYLVHDLKDHPYKLKPSIYSNVCETVGMACFVFSDIEVPTDPLMWAHYAESHHGIAIKIRNDSKISPLMSKVHYVKSQPYLDVAVLDNDDFYISDLYFKSIDWIYENERRLAVPLE